MALDDTFQIVHNFTEQGVKMVNVYHAVRANSGEDAQAVSDAFTNSIIGDIRAWQSVDVSNNDVVVFNLGDEEDFHTQDLAGLLGLRAGVKSPTFLCGGLRFPSTNRSIRSGHKRFGGSLESDYTDGELVAGAITLLEDLGTTLISNWLATSDSHHVANYIIIQRICDETDPATGKCLKYRLPESDLELKFYQPTTRLVKADITSQVSRKTF